jgi:hypothetical protein
MLCAILKEKEEEGKALAVNRVKRIHLDMNCDILSPCLL